MKNIYLLLAMCVGLAVAASGSAADSPQELLNSIEKAIEQSVGAKISDQIPGYCYGNDQFTLNTGGIECPKEISDVKQASDLLRTKLVSTFTNRVDSIRAQRFPPGDDTVIIANIHSKSQDATASITIFKRSSSRVILLPVMVSRPLEK